MVATFGSAYYGIVNALREKLEEYIQLKVAELAAENSAVCWTSWIPLYNSSNSSVKQTTNDESMLLILSALLLLVSQNEYIQSWASQ